MEIKKYALILSIVFTVILVITVFVIFYVDDPSIKDGIWSDMINRLLDLLFVGIIGGAIAYFYKSIEEAKRQELIRVEIRTEYLKRLGLIYRNVKQVRRMLRAAGLTTKYGKRESILISGELKTIYFDKMEEINKYQLELEGLKIEASALPSFVHMKELEGSLKKMERYLGSIVSEYEEYCPIIRNDEPVSLKILKHLDEFTKGLEEEPKVENNKMFKMDFSGPYKLAIEEISKNI